MQNRKTTVSACYPNLDEGILQLMCKKQLRKNQLIDELKKRNEDEKIIKNLIRSRDKLISFKTKERNFYIFDIQKFNQENFEIYREILKCRSSHLLNKIQRNLEENNGNVYLFFAEISTSEKRVNIFQYERIVEKVVFTRIPGLRILPGLTYWETEIKEYNKKAS